VSGANIAGRLDLVILTFLQTEIIAAILGKKRNGNRCQEKRKIDPANGENLPATPNDAPGST